MKIGDYNEAKEQKWKIQNEKHRKLRKNIK